MLASKARALFRSKVGEALSPFDVYGLGVAIPECINAIIAAAEELHKNLQGAEIKRE